MSSRQEKDILWVRKVKESGKEGYRAVLRDVTTDKVHKGPLRETELEAGEDGGKLAYIPFGHENVPTRQRVRSVAEQMKLDELGSVAAVALHLRKPGHTGIQHVRLNHSGSWELRITVVSASKAEGREAYTIDRLGYKSEKAAGLQRDAVMVYVGLDQYDPLHFPEEYKGKLLHQAVEHARKQLEASGLLEEIKRVVDVDQLGQTSHKQLRRMCGLTGADPETIVVPWLADFWNGLSNEDRKHAEETYKP